MDTARSRLVLFLDFDNTITQGDLLDAVLERYSRDASWLAWEERWKKGEISTLECLRRQIATLKPSRTEILEFASAAAIDPYFVPIVRKAAASKLELVVLSDSFTALIDAVFARHGVRNVPVLANELTFFDDRVEAAFPHRDPSCRRCAHCKGQHFRNQRGRETIFVGDGLSDICAADAADTVFAKDALAEHLSRHGKKYRPFDTLGTVLDFLVERGAVTAERISSR